MNFIDFF